MTFSAGWLDDGGKTFDAGFFGMSHKEAETVDPQQRMLLELAWEAFEDGRLAPSRFKNAAVGVFMAAGNYDAGLASADDPCCMSSFSMLGMSQAIMANRISHFFGFSGPSLTIDTACSSSLVALHYACRAMANDKLPMALVGGSSIFWAPSMFIGFSKAGMLSKDGKCRAFDADANGFARGEGGGMILLKPLADAERDGDVVHAVIRATGVNTSANNASIAIPDEDAQAALLKSIYASHKIDMSRLAYIEAHGTGTPVGDPIEARAIGRAFPPERRGNKPLWMGSVKTNIGHLEMASGMAGLLKAVLVLKKRAIPQNLHFANPNPDIDFSSLKLAVPTELVPLPRTAGKALVGVNSFGFGGSNAHVVLEEAKQRKKAAARKAGRETKTIMALSAKSRESLDELSVRYSRLLESDPGLAVADVAAAAAAHRDELRHRLVVTGKNRRDMVEKLASGLSDVVLGDKNKIEAEAPAETPKTAFIFSGNGGVWPKMGQDLLKTNDAFAAGIEKVDALIQPILGWSVMSALEKPGRGEALSKIETAQPMLLAMQVGLVEALAARGVRPDMVYGHSFGEISAAWTAGAITLREAVVLACNRSVLQARMRGRGCLAAVGASPGEAREWIRAVDPAIEIAGVNTPRNLTLVGPESSLGEIRKLARKARRFFVFLHIPYPFHSTLLYELEDEFFRSLAPIHPGKAAIPFISAVSGKRVDGRSLGKEYWWENIAKPVNFLGATETAMAGGATLFLEVGPHKMLDLYIRETARFHSRSLTVLPTLVKGEKPSERFEASWKSAWAHGWPLDWKKIYPKTAPNLALPLYPWNREHVQLEPSPEAGGGLTARPEHPLLGVRRKGDELAWENSLDAVVQPWLDDHRVGERVLFPAAGFVEMTLSAARKRYDAKIVGAESLALTHALEFVSGGMRVVESRVRGEDGAFSIASKKMAANDAWLTHMQARLVGDASWEDVGEYAEMAASPERFGEAVSPDVLYAFSMNCGLRYGGFFRPVTEVWQSGKATLARLKNESAGRMAESERYIMPPQLLDGAFQLGFLALGRAGMTGTYLPYWVDRLRADTEAGPPEFALTTVRHLSEYSMAVDIVMFDKAGVVVLDAKGCRSIVTTAFADMPSERFVNRLVPAPWRNARGDGKNGKQAERAIRAAAASFDAYAEKRGHDAGGTAKTNATLHVLFREVLAPYFGRRAGRLTDIAAAAGLDAADVPYLAFMLETLASAGMASCENGLWKVEAGDSAADFAGSLRALLNECPAALPEARLLLSCREYFRRRLDKRMAAPAGDFTDGWARLLYAAAPDMRAANHAAAMAAEQFIDGAPDGTEVNILLFGDGMADMAALLSPIVSGRPVTVTAASASGEALDETRENVGEANGNWTFEAFDFDARELRNASYDLILAPHCLHAFDNPEAFAAKIRERLAPGGMAILPERTPGVLYDMACGIRPDWWALSLDPQEPVSRLRDADEWRELFETCGFQSVAVVSGRDAAESMGGACIVCAVRKQERADGELPVRSGALNAAASWICVFDADGTEAARRLEESMTAGADAEGVRFTRIAARNGADYASGRGELDPLDCEQWKAAFGEVRAKQPLNLVFGIGFDTDPDSPDTMAILERRIVAAVMLAKGWEASGKPPLRLWLLHGGGSPAYLPGARPVPSQAGLWGVGRTLVNEMGGLDIRFVDMQGGAAGAGGVGAFFDFVKTVESGSPERGAVILGDEIFLPRIEKIASAQPLCGVDDGSEYALALPAVRKIANLHWRRRPPASPGKGMIRVACKAVGLNFRDAMWASDLLPEHALENGFSGPHLGMEGAGVVASVGEGCGDIAVGDSVMFFASQSFASHVCMPANAAVRVPEGMSFAEAATIPVAFSTAWYAMKHLARLKKGESILIHGAAGGVGMAAMQVAAVLGVEVYATAGTPEKRRFLESLGVKRVMDSRSLAFADQVLAATGGRGVDAVLNSIAGEAVARSISCLAPFGRFLELGKRDFYANAPMRLYPFRNNISYFGIDLDQLIAADPEQAGTLIAEVMALFSEKRLHPLPFIRFPADRAVKAFDEIRRSRHISKIVVDMEAPPRRVADCAKPPAELRLSGDATYLVTGGTAGLGLVSAKMLVGRGAKHILLLSRRGEVPETRAFLAECRESGVDAACVAADVGDEQALCRALDAALESRPALRGVVHAAGMLDDAVVANLTAERITPVVRAKAGGAWNLHRYTLGMALDFFLLYSSITTVIGNPGQANYVAANMTLESLAAYRKSRGLPALAIGWSAISEVGMLTRNPKLMATLNAAIGLRAITAAAAVETIPGLLALDESSVVLAKIRMDRIRSLPIALTPLFSRVVSAAGKEGEGRLLGEIVAGMNAEEALSEIQRQITLRLAHLMQTPAKRIPADMPLMGLGVDSLMLVDLMLFLESVTGKPLGAGSLSATMTIRDFAEMLYLDICAEGGMTAGMKDDAYVLENLARRHGVTLSVDKGA